jgi:hypothetical protein
MTMTDAEKKQKKLALQLETLRILGEVTNGSPLNAHFDAKMSGKICSRSADFELIDTTCVAFENALKLITTTGDPD